MLNEDDVLTTAFVDSDTSRYFLGTPASSAINRSISMPLYASQLGVDANPWNMDSQFDDVNGSHQKLNNSTLEDDMMGTNITAASVLVDVELPEIYHTAYMRARPVNERVSLDSLERVISLAELPPRTAQEIVNMVLPAGALYVTHNEFNTALALVACAQKNMDVSLHGVYTHRNDLPSPILLNLEQLNLKQNANPTKPRVDDPKGQVVVDPWSAMAIPNGVEAGSDRNSKLDIEGYRASPTSANKLRPKLSLNGHSTPRSRSMENNAFRTDSLQASLLSSQMGGLAYSHGRLKNTESDGLKKGPADSVQWFLDLDTIRVEAVPEKEGFIFKHVNYTVQSQIRSAKVVRRYSDFYWLWETLMKRYPMRVIPSLPPKKIGAKDQLFLEKRRKGLVRFINGVAQHPALRRDEVLEIFLTEPTEFLAWRRANTPDTDEEFVRFVPNVGDMEAAIPDDLDSRLEKIRAKLPEWIAQYKKMCATIDQIANLNQAQSREFGSYSASLSELSELENQCYVGGCMSCPQMVRGYGAVAYHMQCTGTILDQQSVGISDGILESLKQQRNLLVSFQELLERKDKMAQNQIEGLAKKVAANKVKVNQNRGVPGLEAEVERLDNAIESDQAKMTLQQQRDVHIRYCLASELSYIHKQQAFISGMYQRFVQEQLKSVKQLMENWKTLQDLACEMPMEPDDFA